MRNKHLSFSKKLFWVLAVLLVPLCSIAGTITIINQAQKQVYKFQDITVDQEGNVVVNVDPPINGEPKPSPPPAPEPKPSPPPVSGNCPNPPKDLIQENMPIQRFAKTFKGNQSLAFRIPKCSGTHLFWWDAVNRTRMTKKLVTISECPGDFDTSRLPRQCYSTDVTGTLYYTTSNGNHSSLMCQIEPGPCYVNIKDVESGNGQTSAHQAAHY